MTIIQNPETIPDSAAALLESLQEKAAHKASLRMYFAAADILRDYRGPFAGETQAQREHQAMEYEKMGSVADKERLSHEPPSHPPLQHLGSHPIAEKAHPLLSHWQCPSCHAHLPQNLVVCGHCGFDFRTGHRFIGTSGKPAARPAPIPYAKTLPHHHHGKKRQKESPAVMVFGVIGVVVFLIVVMSVMHQLSVSVTGRPATSSSH
jgi:hypothetical protein